MRPQIPPATSAVGAPLSAVVVELGRLVERRMQRAVRGNGLSASQFMALLRIADAPGISRAELARGLQVSPQAVGGLTNQLVDKGLIERTRSEPGLASAYTLTDDGYEVLDEVRPLIDGLTDDMLRFFRPNLAGTMDGALRHLLERL